MPGEDLRPFLARARPDDAEAMNTRFDQVGHASSAAALFGDVGTAGPPSPDRACCCVARAVVRVVMPLTPDRPHETELLLCGHHYRVSRASLVAAPAQVEELPGVGADDTAWFHDDRTRAYPMVVPG